MHHIFSQLKANPPPHQVSIPSHQSFHFCLSNVPNLAIIQKHGMKALVGRNGFVMRGLVGEVVRSACHMASAVHAICVRWSVSYVFHFTCFAHCRTKLKSTRRRQTEGPTPTASATLSALSPAGFFGGPFRGRPSGRCVGDFVPSGRCVGAFVPLCSLLSLACASYFP